MTQTLPSVAWPPAYKLKKHRLARHVKLRATNAHGLEITIPPRFNVNELPAILETHKSWIIKQLAALRLPPDQYALPDEINFNAVNQTWRIYYMESRNRLKIIERPNREIVLLGTTQDQTACREKLTTWVKERAKDILAAQLHEMSVRTQLPFKQLTVRDQQTVWGSCTYAKAINLNYKLVFLPPSLMRYVLVHELCHTKYLNHSVNFWNLVARYDPEWRERRRALRRANQYIPGWIHTE